MISTFVNSRRPDQPAASMTDPSGRWKTTAWRPPVSRYGISVLVAALLLSYPWIVWGLAPGHDSNVHFQFFQSFYAQLRGGEPYPRWLTDLNEGAGSPVFFVQYPLPFFAAATFHYVLDLPATTAGASHALGLVFFAAAVLLAASLYLWCCRLVARPPAAMAAIAGLTLPYVLWFDFYYRNAIGECLALAFMPLALSCCHDLDREPRRAVAGIALCFGLISFAHIFSAVIFLPAFGFYVAAIRPGTGKRRTLALTALGVALGVGLAGAYLLPLLDHRHHFDIGKLFDQAGGNFDYDNQLFPIDSVVLDSGSRGWRSLMWLTRLGALLSLWLALRHWRRRAPGRAAPHAPAVLALLLVVFSVAAPWIGLPDLFRHTERSAEWVIVQRSRIFGFALLTLEAALISFLALPGSTPRRMPLWLLAGVITCFLLMSRWTSVLWEHLRLLWNLQFPWRYCGLMSILTTGLIAFLFHSLLQLRPRPGRKLLAACSGFAGLAALGAVGWHAHEIYTHQVDFEPGSSVDTALYAYLHTAEPFTDDHPWSATGPMMETRVLQGNGDVHLETLAARHRIVEVTCTEPCTAQLRLLYYPAWVAQDASGAAITLRPTPQTGLMQMSLPSGFHRIELNLPRGVSERLGYWVSLGSLVAVASLAGGATGSRGRRWAHRPNATT